MRRQLELQQEAQRAEIELRRLALEYADANEKAANERLKIADKARMDFAKRGQTFAIYLAAGVTVPLLIAGLVCILLTVAGDINPAVGLSAGSILLAGSLFAGIANLVRNFLPKE